MIDRLRITLDLIHHDGLCIIESPEWPELFVCDETFADALARLPDFLEVVGAKLPELSVTPQC